MYPNVIPDNLPISNYNKLDFACAVLQKHGHLVPFTRIAVDAADLWSQLNNWAEYVYHGTDIDANNVIPHLLIAGSSIDMHMVRMYLWTFDQRFRLSFYSHQTA